MRYNVGAGSYAPVQVMPLDVWSMALDFVVGSLDLDPVRTGFGVVSSALMHLSAVAVCGWSRWLSRSSEIWDG